MLPKKEYFSKALYTIDIGQNDLVQGLLTNMTYDEIKTIIPSTVNRLALNVKKLYDLGARSFWIQNTGPLGCLPYILTLLPVPED
ncbi:SGNH/GDSL hydrolase family protein, partial [Staphylococcus aureus]